MQHARLVSTRRTILSLTAAAVCTTMSPAHGQDSPGTANGEWHHLGGDSAHTRYSPADLIDADNFADLEEAWAWDGASFNAASGRSTPSYIDGILYTVAGPRRHVRAPLLDPAAPLPGAVGAVRVRLAGL